MPRLSRGTWWIIGLMSATLGWTAGGLVGTFVPRMALAVAAAGAAFGLLMRSAATAGIAAVAAAGSGVALWLLGIQAFSPLIAWPAAAFGIGIAGSVSLRNMRARIELLLLAPILGILGFALGVAAVGLAGLGLSDPVITGQFMIGGAGGFGLVVVDGLLNAVRRDRRRYVAADRAA